MGKVISGKKKLFYVGGEDVSLRLPMAKMLIQSGYAVTLVGSECSSVFDNEKIDYYYYKLDREFNLFSDIKTVFQLYSLFRRCTPEVVHTFDTKPNILACIAAWWAGVPRIIRTINGMGSIFATASFRNLLLRCLYGFAQLFASRITSFTIFQNKDDLNYFVSRHLVPRNKAKYVGGSGISIKGFEDSKGSDTRLKKLSAELGLTSGATVILVSRLIRSKGVLEYLEAARLLKSKTQDLNFLLVGDLEEGADAVSRSEILRYSAVCQYLGHRTDVSSLMAISDIVVLPSYYKEGVPRVLLEGAAMGKALISTDVSGCRDIVIDQYNGLLVQARDAAKLAHAILYLTKNPNQRLAMGESGRRLVEDRFSLQKVFEGWTSLY